MRTTLSGLLNCLSHTWKAQDASIISKNYFGHLLLRTFRRAYLCTQKCMLLQTAMMVAAQAETIGACEQCNPETNVRKKLKLGMDAPSMAPYKWSKSSCGMSVANMVLTYKFAKLPTNTSNSMHAKRKRCMQREVHAWAR